MKKIKNKIYGRVIAAVTIVAAFLFGSTPIVAFAGGYECTCENKCTDDCINLDCELCKINYELCCGDEVTEETEDTTEEPEELEEPMGPLTPDGNMTLVDDYGAPSQAGKQFITVVSKSGNYFYIIIDRDDNGTETVHFLNMVDEADLLALMDEDAVNEYIAAKDSKDTETVVTETPEPTEEPDEPEDTKEEEPKKSSSGALIIVLILALGGAGGYLYFTKIKGKKPQKEMVDPDADYTEEDDDYLDDLADEVDEIVTEDEETEDSRLLKNEESDSDEDVSEEDE